MGDRGILALRDSGEQVGSAGWIYRVTIWQGGRVAGGRAKKRSVRNVYLNLRCNWPRLCRLTAGSAGSASHTPDERDRPRRSLQKESPPDNHLEDSLVQN